MQLSERSPRQHLEVDRLALAGRRQRVRVEVDAEHVGGRLVDDVEEARVHAEYERAGRVHENAQTQRAHGQVRVAPDERKDEARERLDHAREHGAPQ